MKDDTHVQFGVTYKVNFNTHHIFSIGIGVWYDKNDSANNKNIIMLQGIVDHHNKDSVSLEKVGIISIEEILLLTIVRLD